MEPGKQAYREAVARDPKLADAWNNLGWSLWSLGYVQEACGHFEVAVQLGAASERPRNNLEACRQRLGTPPTVAAPVP